MTIGKKILLIKLLIICVITLFFGITITYNKSTKILKTPISEKLKNGDLILRCGKSLESYAVVLADSKAQFSHVGIICFENNKPYVIHAVPHKKQFIKKETIQTFLNSKNASKYAIYRTNFNENILKKVVFEAQKFYNKHYTFDNDYNLKTDTKLYCTELVLKAFKNAGIQLKLNTKEYNFVLGKHAIIFPSEFTNNPIFYKPIY